MNPITSYKIILLDFDGTICDLKVDWKGLKADITNVFSNRYDFANWKLMQIINYIYQTQDKNLRLELLAIVERYEMPSGVASYSNFNFQLIEQCEGCTIISNNLSSTINQVLRRENLTNMIKNIYGIDDVFQSKPSNSIFNTVQKSYQEFDLKNYLYIGDTETDREFAKNCGIDFINIKDI